MSSHHLETGTVLNLVWRGGAVARDVCSAMEYLHKEGIVHGDLAGGNVLLTSAPTPHGFCAKVCCPPLPCSCRFHCCLTRVPVRVPFVCKSTSYH